MSANSAVTFGGAFSTKCNRDDQDEVDSSKDPFFKPSSAQRVTILAWPMVQRGCGIDWGLASALSFRVIGSVLKGFGKEFSCPSNTWAYSRIIAFTREIWSRVSSGLIKIDLMSNGFVSGAASG